MASRPAPATWRYLLLAVTVAGAIAFANWKRWLPAEAHFPPSGKVPREARRTPRPQILKPPASRKAGEFEELRGCTLVEDRGNDGDSFLIRHGTREIILRLYFADCPEKYRHPKNGERIADQGRYFGGLSEEETILVGESAREFSLNLLRSAPFTILTKREQVFDSNRFYAFVTVGKDDLAELLVKKGLARIYTKGEVRPGITTITEGKQRLAGLERQAKNSRAGAWGLKPLK